MTTPLLLIVGKSGSGKTTLIEKLIPELTQRGYRLGTIKHTHHEIDPDVPQKDSRRHLDAGAAMVMIASKNNFSLVKAPAQDRLSELTPYFRDVDLIITEGFKTEAGPKIEVIRSATGKKPLFSYSDIGGWIALVADLFPSTSLPCFHPEEIVKLADFIEQKFLIPSTA